MESTKLCRYNWVRDKQTKVPYCIQTLTKRKIGYHLNNVSQDSDRLYYERLHDLEPIPLTIDILEKNGFQINREEHLYEYSEIINGIRYFCRVSFYDEESEGEKVMVFDGIYVNVYDIHYLHELQNALLFSPLFNHGQNIKL